jgi:hypothetical protein
MELAINKENLGDLLKLLKFCLKIFKKFEYYVIFKIIRKIGENKIEFKKRNKKNGKMKSS